MVLIGFMSLRFSGMLSTPTFSGVEQSQTFFSIAWVTGCYGVRKRMVSSIVVGKDNRKEMIDVTGCIFCVTMHNLCNDLKLILIEIRY